MLDELYEEPFNLQFRKRVLDDNEDYIEKVINQCLTKAPIETAMTFVEVTPKIKHLLFH